MALPFPFVLIGNHQFPEYASAKINRCNTQIGILIFKPGEKMSTLS